MTTLNAVRIRSFAGPAALELTGIERWITVPSLPCRSRDCPPGANQAELIEIGRLIDAGRVHPHGSAVFELKQAAEAQAQLEGAPMPRARWSCRWAEAPLLRGIPGRVETAQAAVRKGEMVDDLGNFPTHLALKGHDC